MNQRNPRSVQQHANPPICRRNSVPFIVRESHAHELLAPTSEHLCFEYSKQLNRKSLKSSTMRYAFVVSFLLITILSGPFCHAADIETITHGDRVDIKQHLVTGKYVLFDFYADWCGPCKSLEPVLTKLASQQSGSIALRKVDVIDWHSAVSQQYKISSLPHLKLFGPDGSLIAEGGAGQVLEALESRLGSGIVGSAQGSSSSSIMPFLVFSSIIGFVAYLLFFKGAKKPLPNTPPVEERGWTEEAPAPSDAIWFVMMQGSLSGPFSVDDLEDLKRRKCISSDSKIRRKGDSDWRGLSDL